MVSSLDEFEFEDTVAPEVEDVEGFALEVEGDARRPLQGHFGRHLDHADELLLAVENLEQCCAKLKMNSVQNGQKLQGPVKHMLVIQI